MVDLPSLVRYCLQIEGPYYIQGVRSQLKPRVWLDILTSGSGVDPDLHFLLDGIVNGFRVLDRHSLPSGYNCKNYGSCYGVDNHKKLTEIVKSEYDSGKLTKVSKAPLCVHALGTIKKKRSEKIRPITDCSRPDHSVNKCMEGVHQSIYLDDVICLSESYEEGVRNQLEIIRVFRSLGFHIAWPKVTSPATKCVYLGIVLDLENQTLSLPKDRLLRLRKELNFWSGRRKATEKQLQVLIGHLCHCSRIIKGGNLYLHFLFKALYEAKSKRRIKLSHEFHQDISWWLVCAESFNSVLMFDTRVEQGSVALLSDSVTISTSIQGVKYELDFPCVFVFTSTGDYRMDVSLANDRFVGCHLPGVKNVDGMDMELLIPDHLVGDDVSVEICALWAVMINSGFSSCGIKVICHRKLT